MNDEQAIKALNDIFVLGLLSKDPKKRASIWLDDGTLLPPNAGFLKGRAEIEKHFALEGPRSLRIQQPISRITDLTFSRRISHSSMPT